MNRGKILEYLYGMKREASDVAKAEEALLVLFPGAIGIHASVTSSQDALAEILDDELGTDAVGFWLYEMNCGNDPDNCKMVGRDGVLYDVSRPEGLLGMIEAEQ